MVNKGQIHRKLGKFLMISSNLIKSDDEMVIEIRKSYNLRKEDSKTNPRNQKSLDLDLISWRNHRMNRGAKKPKIGMKLTKIMILN